ncbi:phosphoglycolate phosphatase [Thermogemmatispora aurantia]|uniref:Phosphoglycolate phosphatase n=1 Tax=Thermogemmatispora aurantia TaxID=2045279 RepID=A0A5J4K327_9CHLR|nr:HAD family hydrolase [Thermogemmatispora aurantia]GER83228.1 phosphoglycolate phosphatase [Thermogemmatispora aurantia]
MTETAESKAARPFQAVLFDWDGTIADSTRGMMAAMQFAYKQHTGRIFPRNMEEFRQLSPLRLAESTARYAGPHAEEVAASYLWYYTHEGYRSTCLYPGVRELLEELRRRGYPLVVVTNTGPERLSTDLRHLELSALLTVTVTSQDTSERKPHPAPLWKAREKLIAAGLIAAETPAERLAYVGDHPGDMAAAHAAGMVAIAAFWGGIFPPESLLAERPEYWAHQPAELLTLFP